MELLAIVGIALVVVTAACAAVEAMAEARGRDPRAWALAAFVGLLCAVVGYFIVVGALLLVGPTQSSSAKRPATASQLPHAPRL